MIFTAAYYAVALTAIVVAAIAVNDKMFGEK